MYKSIFSSFFKFLYYLVNEWWLLPVIYPIYKIHFPTNSLYFLYSIKILFLHYFFNILFNSSFIHTGTKKLALKFFNIINSFYCSWAKNFLRYREIVGAMNYGFIFYYRENFGFSYTIGGSLTQNRLITIIIINFFSLVIFRISVQC